MRYHGHEFIDFQFKKHPGENSSLTFAFASIVTHSLFRTDIEDWTKNNTSSYLDLSPLYGINQAQQDSVRNRGLGRGLLYPDTFAEERLGFLPAAVSALLVIFCRNHNVRWSFFPFNFDVSLTVFIVHRKYGSENK